MAKYLWLKVTLDKYELPLAVAETSEELARLVGVSGNAVRVGRSQEKRGWKRSSYKKVRIDEDEE